MDYKFWLPLALTIYGLYLNRKQVHLMNPLKQSTGTVLRIRKHWPLLTMVLFVIFVWAPYVYTNFIHSGASVPSNQEWLALVQNLKVVQQQTFTNREVELDGNAYENCTFKNVTFVWKGQKPFTLANNSIDDSGNPLQLVIPVGPLGESGVFVAELLNDMCRQIKCTAPRINIILR